MTKVQLTRFTCDAPNCDDVADVPAQFPAPLIGSDIQPSLPDGWIEFHVVGVEGGQMGAVVHASRPACAGALAKNQVNEAVKGAEAREKQEAEDLKKAEEARIAGEKAAEENTGVQTQD